MPEPERNATVVDCPNCRTNIRVSFTDAISGGRLWSWGLADYGDAWESNDPRAVAVEEAKK